MIWVFYGVCIAFEFVVLLMGSFLCEVYVFLSCLCQISEFLKLLVPNFYLTKISGVLGSV